MSAIRVHQYGGADELTYTSMNRPTPQAGEVLVRVLSAAVNPVDWQMRQGLLQHLLPVQLPYTPGGDLAGIIEEIGPAVTAFQQGQAVYGYTGYPQGGYAEYAVASINSLALKPETLSFDEAATLPTGATTAWEGLFEHGKLKFGQRVLIQGAAGGVGAFAVQFAQRIGAQVIGTTSSHNVDYVRSLGAEVVDYTKTSVEQAVEKVDLVFDAVGGETVEQSMHVLRPGGTFVSVTAPPPQELLQKYDIRGVFFLAQITTASLETTARLIAEGSVKVTIATTFPLRGARQAHRLSQQRHGRGRIILHVANNERRK